MRNKLIIFVIAMLFIIEISICILAINQVSSVKQDTIKVNEIVKTIEGNYGDSTKYSKSLDYTVIDNNETVTYKTKGSKSESINEAVQNNDIILDLVVDGNIVGKVLIVNSTNTQLRNTKTYILCIIIILIL